MAIISEQDQQHLRDYFAEKLVHPVTLRFYTQRESVLSIPGQECQTCADTHRLLEELVALSDKLRLDVRDFLTEQEQARQEGIEEIPAIVLEGQNKGTVRFIGVPAGYEFATLIEDLVDVSRGTTGLQAHSREVLAGLTAPVHVKVFVTPT
ncbi:MAG: thioredoxin family protein [Sphaerobacter sp.]|nr:thioredoxin family protein [Sphaerobacter sp.]